MDSKEVTSITTHGETATLLSLETIHKLHFSSEMQKLEMLPRFITRMKIPSGLNLEFQLYSVFCNEGDQVLVGTSKNGILQFTPTSADLTDAGQIFVSVSKDDVPPTLSFFTSSVGIDSRYHSFDVKLIYAGNPELKLCKNWDTIIPLTIEYVNTWLCKQSYPFGFIGQYELSNPP